MRKSLFVIFVLTFITAVTVFAQQKVTFNVTTTSPTKTNTPLFLAGDFNNWKPADTAWRFTKNKPGGYQLFKTLPNGKYNFKITRGDWQTVECTAAGTAIANRSVMISNDTTIDLKVEQWQDNFSTPEKQHTASKQVHIISEAFAMPQLGRERRIWIYLPKTYDNKKRYPVIYMHDGQNLFDEYTSGYGEWGVDEILNKMPAAKQSIVVGIDHGGENRITEYDPYDSKYGKGYGNDYVEFIVKTLKPYIDKHYKTKPGATYTTVAGSSMGGLISMYAALKYPAVFGNAGIFSPAFWIAPQIYSFASKQVLPAGTRFYFVCGDAESDSMVTDMQKMVGILKGKVKSNADVTAIIVKGAGHNEKQWNADFPGFYEWLMKSSSFLKI